MEKLKMWRYKPNKDGTSTELSSNSFSATINPASLERSFGLLFSKDKAAGSQKRDQKLHAVDDETLSFKLTLDGTGALPLATGASLESVYAQLSRLRAVVYTEPAATEEISRIHIVWGELDFRCRLKSITVQHKLFSPSGKSLRAEVSLSFVSATSTKEAALTASSTSADHISQERQATEGDTLALLCDEIYGDAGYCDQIARINNLPSLRSLPPGTILVFPPLAPAARAA